MKPSLILKTDLNTIVFHTEIPSLNVILKNHITIHIETSHAVSLVNNQNRE